MSEGGRWVIRIVTMLALVAYWAAAIILGTPWWWQW